MMQNKKVAGITGGSGSGKSYISQKLRDMGFFVVDADKTAHKSIQNADCVREISAEFGEAVLKDGQVDRKLLGAVVFSQPEKLEKLNEITHKYILKDIETEIKKADGELVFVDGAVLIESGMPCDFMIGVLADREIRKKRIMSRDAISEKDAALRLDAQQPDGFYKSHCDFIVTNNGEDIDVSSIIKRIEK